MDLLDFEDHWLIVMPDHVPLRLVLYRLSEAPIVYSFQKKFLEDVAFMHVNKVGHLDLKLGNIVIDISPKSMSRGSGSLYIIDFGVAERGATTRSVIEDVCGTRGWRAPEILKGVAERGEIYAGRTGPLDGSGPYGVAYGRRPLARVTTLTR